MPAAGKRIILFTRYPEPGITKTRLIPALGAEGAATLHRQLTEHALRAARNQDVASVEVAWTGGSEPAMRSWLGPDISLREQDTGDLGERMSTAFWSAFKEGVTEVVIAGSDCPDIDRATYEAAFDALRDHDLVLGPAVDGGYYLIGLKASAGPMLGLLMEGVEWGTNSVLSETLEGARIAGLRVAQLATLADVDLPSDLPVWQRCSGAVPRPPLSVVLCALNDAVRLGASLDALGQSKEMEVIVADGGSTDETCAIATQHGATVVHAPRGRAAQFNLGAAHAASESLLFLHADTRVPLSFHEEIKACLMQSDVSAGAFRFATDFDSLAMRIVTASTNIRSTRFQLPYGDQGLFLRRETFRRAGGFPRMPIMEDFMLVRRLQRLGRIAIAPSAAITSGDRWRRLGVWRTTLRNARIVALHELGVSPDRLARMYRRGAE